MNTDYSIFLHTLQKFSALSRFSGSPWDLEAKPWDREIASQTMSLTIKPWELEGLVHFTVRFRGKTVRPWNSIPNHESHDQTVRVGRSGSFQTSPFTQAELDAHEASLFSSPTGLGKRSDGVTKIYGLVGTGADPQRTRWKVFTC